MRAALAEQYGRPLTVTEVADPVPGPGEVLVRVEASGVCATDLKVIEGGLGADPRRLPLIPGHEIVGTIAAVGQEASGVSVGDRVAVHALFSCGRCDYCQAGEDEACPSGIPNLAGVGVPGGYAGLVCVPAVRALPLPASLGPVEAAPLLCAGLTVYAGLKNARLEPGQRVAVLGIGGLGHLAIPIARALGADVVAVTSSADKAAAARDLGAMEVATAENAGDVLNRLGGAHVILNTVDASGPLMGALPGVRTQGSLVMATTTVGDFLPIPAPLLMRYQLRVIASFFGSKSDLAELLDLAVAHGIRPITEEHDLGAVNEAHDRLRTNRVRFRAVLRP